MDKKILVGGAIIDFYVNKKKYRDYKTEIGRINYLNKRLEEIFSELIGKTFNGVTLRDVSITSNHLWGEEVVEIPDLNYSISNQKQPVSEELGLLPLREFHIDIIGVTDKENDFYFEIEGDDFFLSLSNYKLV